MTTMNYSANLSLGQFIFPSHSSVLNIQSSVKYKLVSTTFCINLLTFHLMCIAVIFTIKKPSQHSYLPGKLLMKTHSIMLIHRLKGTFTCVCVQKVGMTLTLATDSTLIPLINKQFAFLSHYKHRDDRQSYFSPPHPCVCSFASTLKFCYKP